MPLFEYLWLDKLIFLRFLNDFFIMLHIFEYL